jgi:hypothetical protein
MNVHVHDLRPQRPGRREQAVLSDVAVRQARRERQSERDAD